MGNLLCFLKPTQARAEACIRAAQVGSHLRFGPSPMPPVATSGRLPGFSNAGKYAWTGDVPAPVVWYTSATT